MNDVIKQRHREPDEVGRAMITAIAEGQLERRDPPVEHYFAEGLYGRRIIVEAGTLVVTMKHKVQHLTIALKGACLVSDESGARTQVTAPGMWVTEPGTQRSVLCLTDVEWVTVHANPDNIRDVDVLTPILADDTMEKEKVLLLGDLQTKPFLEQPT